MTTTTYLKMIHPKLALEQVMKNVEPLGAVAVGPCHAVGRVLAEDVVADRNYPPFARAMMDGVAVRLADAGKQVRVIGEVAAGQAPAVRLVDGQCVEIMTGAACPEGTEAVVPVEVITRKDNLVQLPAGVTEGRHIAPEGSDCRKGDVAMQAGELVTPVGVGVLASFGHKPVWVVVGPQLGIVATGAELVSPAETPNAWQLRDSNGPQLRACALAAGVEQAGHIHVTDTAKAIRGGLEQMAEVNIILLTGGVSMGKYDLVPGVVEAFGADIIFHKVIQKPGKPLLFARRGDQLIFGLPGNPLACMLCYHRYVAPAIRVLSGLSAPDNWLAATLSEPIKQKSGRVRYLLAHASRQGNGWSVTPRNGVSSADVFHSNGANCYLCLPEGVEQFEAGDTQYIQWLGAHRWTS